MEQLAVDLASEKIAYCDHKRAINYKMNANGLYRIPYGTERSSGM